MVQASVHHEARQRLHRFHEQLNLGLPGVPPGEAGAQVMGQRAACAGT